MGGFCGYGGSVWVMAEWAVVCVLDSGCHQLSEIYGLYSVEYHKVEKWPYKVGCGLVLWVWWVYVGDG